MEIIKEVNGTELTFKISGRIDTHTSQQLESEITDNISGMTKLLFDLSGVTYLSSAGLRVFVAASGIMQPQGAMTITGVSADLMEVFKITGVANIVNIQPE